MKTNKMLGRSIYTILSVLLIVTLLMAVVPTKAVSAGGGGYPTGMQIRITFSGCKNSVITNLRYMIVGKDQYGIGRVISIQTSKSPFFDSVSFIRGKWWKSAYIITYIDGKVLFGPYRGETFSKQYYGTAMPILQYRYPNNYIINAKISNMCPPGY